MRATSPLMTGLQLSQNSIDNGVSRFQRVEDGAWDPRPANARDFYFVTTASIDQQQPALAPPL